MSVFGGLGGFGAPAGSGFGTGGFGGGGFQAISGAAGTGFSSGGFGGGGIGGFKPTNVSPPQAPDHGGVVGGMGIGGGIGSVARPGPMRGLRGRGAAGFPPTGRGGRGGMRGGLAGPGSGFMTHPGRGFLAAGRGAGSARGRGGAIMSHGGLGAGSAEGNDGAMEDDGGGMTDDVLGAYAPSHTGVAGPGQRTAGASKFLVEDAAPGTALFIKRVPIAVTDRSLRAHFSSFGQVRGVTLDPVKRLGTVAFSKPEEAAAALVGGAKIGNDTMLMSAYSKGGKSGPPLAWNKSAGPGMDVQSQAPVTEAGLPATFNLSAGAKNRAEMVKANLLRIKQRQDGPVQAQPGRAARASENAAVDSLETHGPVSTHSAPYVSRKVTVVKPGGKASPPAPASVPAPAEAAPGSGAGLKRQPSGALLAQGNGPIDRSPSALSSIGVKEEGGEEEEEYDEEDEEDEGTGEEDVDEEEKAVEEAVPQFPPSAPVAVPALPLVVHKRAEQAVSVPFAVLRRGAPTPIHVAPAAQSSSSAAPREDGMVGTSAYMCPLREQALRDGAHAFEKDWPEMGILTRDAMVTKHTRSSAGQDAATPDDLRPPHVLVRTVDHLVHKILDADKGAPDPRFGNRQPGAVDVQVFIEDRMRAIGKDWKSQNYREGGRNDAWAQETLERIVRTYIVMYYTCLGSADFGRAQHEEQMNAHFKMLVELYDDARRRSNLLAAVVPSVPGQTAPPGLASPCEAEFRGYYVLFTMGDRTSQKGLLAMLSSLPRHVFQSREVQHALACWTAMSTGNTVRFFRLVRSSLFLEAVLLVRHFATVREDALRVMVNSYCPPPGARAEGNITDLIDGSDGALQKMPDYVTWEHVAAKLAMPWYKQNQANPEERARAREAVLAVCTAHGIKVEIVGAGPGVKLKPRTSAFSSTSDVMKLEGLHKEPHLIPVVNMPRSALVDMRRWAGEGMSAAFSPMGSLSGVFPSGSRYATDLHPGASGAVSLSSLASSPAAVAKVMLAPAPQKSAAIKNPNAMSEGLTPFVSVVKEKSSASSSGVRSHANTIGAMPSKAVQGPTVTEKSAAAASIIKPGAPFNLPSLALQPSTQPLPAVPHVSVGPSVPAPAQAAAKLQAEADKKAVQEAAERRHWAEETAAAARIAEEKAAQAEEEERERMKRETDVARAQLVSVLADLEQSCEAVRQSAQSALRSLALGSARLMRAQTGQAVALVVRRQAILEASEDGPEERHDGWAADGTVAAALFGLAARLAVAVRSMRHQLSSTTIAAEHIEAVKHTAVRSLQSRTADLERAWSAFEGKQRKEAASVDKCTTLLQSMRVFLLRKWRRKALAVRLARKSEGKALARALNKVVPARARGAARAGSLAIVPAGKRRRMDAGVGAARGTPSSGSGTGPTPLPGIGGRGRRPVLVHAAQQRLARLYASVHSAVHTLSHDAWLPLDVAGIAAPILASRARVQHPHAYVRTGLFFKLVVLPQVLGSVEASQFPSAPLQTPVEATSALLVDRSVARLTEAWLLTKLARVVRPGRLTVHNGHGQGGGQREPLSQAGARMNVDAGAARRQHVTIAEQDFDGEGEGERDSEAAQEKAVADTKAAERAQLGARFGMSNLKRKINESRAESRPAHVQGEEEEEDETELRGSEQGAGGDAWTYEFGPSRSSPLDIEHLHEDAAEGAVLSCYTARVSMPSSEHGKPVGVDLGVVVRAVHPGTGSSSALLDRRPELAGAQALLLVVHASIRAMPTGDAPILLVDADWTHAQSRLAPAVLMCVPDSAVSVTVALVLHQHNAAGNGHQNGTCSALRIPWEQALDVAFIRSSVAVRLGLPQLPPSLVRGAGWAHEREREVRGWEAAVAVLNPAVLVHAVARACGLHRSGEEGEEGEDEVPSLPMSAQQANAWVSSANITALMSAGPGDEQWEGGQLPITDSLGPAACSQVVLEACVRHLATAADPQPRTLQMPILSLIQNGWAACLPHRPAGQEEEEVQEGGLLPALRVLHGLSAACGAAFTRLIAAADGPGLLYNSAIVYPPPELAHGNASIRGFHDALGIAALEVALQRAPLTTHASVGLASCLVQALQSLAVTPTGAPATSATLSACVQVAYSAVQTLLDAHAAHHPDPGVAHAAGEWYEYEAGMADDRGMLVGWTVVGPASSLHTSLRRLGLAHPDGMDEGELFALSCALLPYPFTPSCRLCAPDALHPLSVSMDRLLRAWAASCLFDLQAWRGDARAWPYAGEPLHSYALSARPIPWLALVRLIVEDRLSAAVDAGAVVAVQAHRIGEGEGGMQQQEEEEGLEEFLASAVVQGPPAVLLQGLRDAQTAARACVSPSVSVPADSSLPGELTPVHARESIAELQERRVQRGVLAKLIATGSVQGRGRGMRRGREPRTAASLLWASGVAGSWMDEQQQVEEQEDGYRGDSTADPSDGTNDFLCGLGLGDGPELEDVLDTLANDDDALLLALVAREAEQGERERDPTPAQRAAQEARALFASLAVQIAADKGEADALEVRLAAAVQVPEDTLQHVATALAAHQDMRVDSEGAGLASTRIMTASLRRDAMPAPVVGAGESAFWSALSSARLEAARGREDEKRLQEAMEMGMDVADNTILYT